MVRKLLSLAVAIGISASAMAQYYYLPGGTGNPNNLNQENAEYPLGSGLPAGWNTVLGPGNASGTWSSVQTLPITFNFNGGAVTSYQVSSSGVLTFSSNPGIAPPYGGIALPSATIPDSSVCITGIRGTGTNDNIVSKTFGSAPNRQHWIFFSSYSDAAGNWTYWAIVLEEGTDKIYAMDMRHATAVTGVSIGIQIDATSAIGVNGGAANISSLAGGDPSAADNVYYEFVPGSQPNYDLAVTTSAVPNFLALVNAPFTISGELTNLGATAITSYDLNYSINGGAPVTTSISGVNVATFATDNFSSTTTWSPASIGSYEIKMWASNINGNVDEVPGNDTLVQMVDILAFETTRKVVIEEGTGTWCGWCPRGAVAMQYMTENYHDNFIGIAVHNGDPMTLAAYDNGAGITGFPGMNVDRTILGAGVTTGTMEGYTLERVQALPPANISITNASLDHTNGDISVSVEGHFAADLNGDYRFALIVVEDSVTGSGQGWGQVNYYAGGQNGQLSGAGKDWHLEPSTVPAADMWYDHVGVKLVGGYDGVAGSIPTTIAANDKHSFTFTDNISADVIRYTKVKFVALIIGPNGEIINGEEKSMAPGVSVEENTFESSVFPNPATDYLTVRLAVKGNSDVAVQVYDMMGKQVLNKFNTLNAGTYNLPVDLSALPAGIYNVNLDVNGERVTHKIIVQ